MKNLEQVLTDAAEGATFYPYWKHWRPAPDEQVVAGMVRRADVEAIRDPGETLGAMVARVIENAARAARRHNGSEQTKTEQTSG